MTFAEDEMKGPSALRLRLVLLVLAALVLGVHHAAELTSLPRQLPPTWSKDARELRQASALLDGEGRGPYRDDALRTRPGEIIHLARSAQWGLGERRMRAILDTLAIFVLAAFLLRLGLPLPLALAAFFLALANPALLGNLSQRLSPELLSAPLALLVIGGLLHAALEGDATRRLVTMALTGFPLAALVVTNPDWTRLLPFTVIGLALPLVRDLRRGPRQVAAMRLALGIILIATPVAFATARLEAAHELRYGVGLLSDEDSPEFEAALGAIQRVARTKSSGRLDRELRAKLYEVSPSFARLREAFDSELFSGPKGPDDDGGRPPVLVRETLRTAARGIGVYSDGDTMRAFYAAVASELDDAIDEGRLPGLPGRLETDDPGFSISSLGLVWSRLGELWRISFIDLVAGDPLPRNELDGESLEAAERVLGALPEARPESDDEARSREGRLIFYRRLMPGLWVLAASGLFMRLIAIRKRGFDPLLTATLLVFAALLFPLIALSNREATWLIDPGGGYLYLHLATPFFLALGAKFHVDEAVALIRAKERMVLGAFLVVMMGTGAAFTIFGAQSLAAGPREAILTATKGAAITVPVDRARGEAFVFVKTDDEARIRLDHDPERSGAGLLVIEAEVKAPLGAAFELEWEGPGRDGRGKNARRLFVKEANARNRWEFPVSRHRLGDFVITAPESPGLALTFHSVAIEPLERRFVIGPDPLPAVAARRLDDGRIEIEVRGGEPESRYEFYFSKGLSSVPRVYPERSGALYLDDAGGLRDAAGGDLKVRLTTDASGSGAIRVRLEASEPLPERFYTQGLGTQHFCAEAVLVD